MATMPRPDVQVTQTVNTDSGVHDTAITVSRDGKQRTWSGAGPISASSTAEAVKKMLDDPYTAEYVKESR